MRRPMLEVADIIQRFGESFISKHQPNSYQIRVLRALSMCRTSALGGHKYRCDHCGCEHISYNSCRNRHCPKCQCAKQAFWVEDRINNAYSVKHYHIVFTVPEALNEICLIDSKWFYNHLFETVWDVLHSFGYSHFTVESGAICILHTWGQNLSLHPHIHCIVPALGYTFKGLMKQIGRTGKYLYPVTQLSLKFRGKFLAGVKKHLARQDLLSDYLGQVKDAWNKPWVVYCEPSLGKPQHVVGYLGQYIHRVAITNHRIIDIGDHDVLFSLKDYSDQGKQKTTSLTGEEFLRRFCLHILPSGFVKIRHYGIYSSRFRSTILKDKCKMVIKPVETTIERINRLTGIDICRCPWCKTGRLILADIVPRSHSPDFTWIRAYSSEK
jgi:Putative transposase/Transposase zinc-binding domain